MADGNINGLSTPALDAKYLDALESTKAAEKSSLEIAAAVEHKLKALKDRLDRDDADIDNKLEALASRLKSLQQQL